MDEATTFHERRVVRRKDEIARSDVRGTHPGSHRACRRAPPRPAWIRALSSSCAEVWCEMLARTFKITVARFAKLKKFCSPAHLLLCVERYGQLHAVTLVVEGGNGGLTHGGANLGCPSKSRIFWFGRARDDLSHFLREGPALPCVAREGAPVGEAVGA